MTSNQSKQRQIELKATGETITFMEASKALDGPSLETLVTLPASGEGPPLHRHVFQDEVFEAMDGKLGLESGGQQIVLSPGETLTVPANTVHRCYAVDGKEIRFKATFSPSLNIEYFLSEMFEACNRKNAKDPSPFDACYILQQVKGEYYLGAVPTIMQKTIFPLLAWFGKGLGLVKAKSKREWEKERSKA